MTHWRASLLLLMCVLASGLSGCSIYAVLFGEGCNPPCAEGETCTEGTCFAPGRVPGDDGGPGGRDAGGVDANEFDAGAGDAGDNDAATLDAAFVDDGGDPLLDAGPGPDAGPDGGPFGLDAGGFDVAPVVLDGGLPDVIPHAVCEMAFANVDAVCDAGPAPRCEFSQQNPGQSCNDACGSAGLFCAQGEWDPQACPFAPEGDTGCAPALEQSDATPVNWDLMCVCQATPLIPPDCPSASGNITACDPRTDGCAYSTDQQGETCDDVCGALGLGCQFGYDATILDQCVPNFEGDGEKNCDEEKPLVGDLYCLCEAG